MWSIFSSSPPRVCSPGQDNRQHSDLQEAEKAPETQVGPHTPPLHPGSMTTNKD